MCTLTFIPRNNGYYLAMNRDERIARGTAASPARIELGKMNVIYPRDVEGGTWIAANELGLGFALLNWNDVIGKGAKALKTKSRGFVIQDVVHLRSRDQVQGRLNHLDLTGILPFRLVGVFPAEKQLWEWRWDMSTLKADAHSWDLRHWFSSSLSDEQASLRRGRACQAAWRDKRAGTLQWVRKLHRSHAGGAGPFSVCVHREDAQTVSYAELICTLKNVRCNYFSGSPCRRRATRLLTTQLGRRAPGVETELRAS
jgi:hypothetical protein